MGTTCKASIKETGEELSSEAWKRFEEAADHVQQDGPTEKLREQDEAVGKHLPKEAPRRT